MVQPIHTAVRGRARYKVKGLYHSESLKRDIEKGLFNEARVISFSVNTLTGNVLVFFPPEESSSVIASLLKSILDSYIKKLRESGPPARTGTSPAKAKAPLREKFKKIGRHEEQDVAHWHLISAEDALNLTSSQAGYGLTSEAAAERLKKFGPNILPEAVKRSGFEIFAEQFKSIPVALLGVAAGLSIFTGGISDAVLIAGVVLINAAIGYVTETQAEKTISSLKTLVRPYATVLRDGLPTELDAKDVVPGDVIILKPGSYVAADSRLIEADFLAVDESALTGESMPVTKNTETMVKLDVPLADRLNMAYMGTLVIGGQGYAVVVATGEFTEIGRIQTMMGEAQSPETPMERQLRVMGGQLVVISGGVCAIVFIIGLLRGYGFLQMLQSSISLAVAAVPEGLPTIATTTLALGIRKMRKHNVLIRHLEAVETLGSVQTISFDKTGTITMNRMTVVEVYAGGIRLKISDGKFISDTDRVNPYAMKELLMLLHVSVISNETKIDFKEWRIRA